MSWLNYSGHTPAELQSGYQLHGGQLPASLFNRPDPWGEAMKAIAPAIKDYIHKKKNDEIANALMNMEQPPRAQAVDPSLQGAPATQPFTGGAEGFKLHNAYQTYLDQQQEDAVKSASEERKARLDEANITKLTATDPTRAVTVGDQTFNVPEATALQAAVAQQKQVKPDSQESVSSDLMATTGHSWADWNQLMTQLPATEGGWFSDAKPAHQNPNLTTDPSGQNYVGMFPSDKDTELHPATLPIQAFKNAQARMAALQGGPAAAAQSTSAQMFSDAQQAGPAVPPKVMGRPTDAATSKIGEVPVQVKTADEAMKYPAGTLIKTPDGRLKRVPGNG